MAFLDECAATRGDAFFVNVRGWAQHLILTRPDDIRRVMKYPGTILSAGAAGAIMQPVLGPHSLFVLEGQTHTDLRRRLIAGLRSDRCVGLVEEMVAQALPSFPAGATRVGALHDWFKTLSMSVILALLLGRCERAAVVALTRAFERVFSDMTTILMLMPWLQRIQWPGTPGRFLRGRLNELDAILLELSRSVEPGRGLLGDMEFEGFGAAAADARRDTAVTVIAAGYETVATALAWLTCHFAANRSAQQAVRAALAGRGGEGDAVLESACLESLRLMPTVEIVSRTALQDCEVNGIEVRAGTLVSPCIYLANRSPEAFPEPLAFRFDRFLNRKAEPTQFFPFGLGIRRCVGAGLSMDLMKTTLARLVSRYELAAPPGARARPRRHHVTIKPAPTSPIMVRAL